MDRHIIMADITGITMAMAAGMAEVGTGALPGTVAAFTLLPAASMGLSLTAGGEFM